MAFILYLCNSLILIFFNIFSIDNYTTWRQCISFSFFFLVFSSWLGPPAQWWTVLTVGTVLPTKSQTFLNSCLPLLPSPWTLHQWSHWCPECSLHIPVVTTWLSPEDSFPCHLSSRQCFRPWPEYHRVRGWDRVLLAPHCFFLCIPVSPLKFQLWTSCHQIIPPPTTPYHCCCLVTKSCLTFCDTMDCSLPGSFAHGISQVRELEWVAISCSRRCSQTRDRTHISCIADGFFTTEPQEHLLVPGSFPSVLWWMFLLVYALIHTLLHF